MKAKFFSIKEIAEMYGISTHIIRHYEKIGLLTPERTENNYRLYSEKEIYLLNIIRDLRELDVPLESIEAYLKDRTLATTQEIFRENQRLLKEKIALMEKKLAGVTARNRILDQLQQQELPIERIVIEEKVVRPYFWKKVEYGNEAEFETAMRELYGEVLEQSSSYEFHFVAGIISDSFEMTYEGILFLTNSEKEDVVTECNCLEAGTYASYFYQGDYEQAGNHLEEMKDQLKQQGYQVELPFYEFYLIDFHETQHSDEFLTEIQVRLVD
ncbi:MerR family transcriptional regulator [Candidatus Enterococcus ferrettii]|uniref:HTH merR-type domain-containing protein n=1 Tax=Candidatus Enterococcus ferrettii TaxID=2815324 RepID=A0ABV0EP51_9ENTE|nr:MerR family transcriptional regulator [Enterococcus sp. 665A]